MCLVRLTMIIIGSKLVGITMILKWTSDSCHSNICILLIIFKGLFSFYFLKQFLKI